MVDKNKSLVCCLLATSAIMLSEKRKESLKCGVRSGIWKGIYHAMLICWMNVPWDDAIVVSAGKLRKLWDSLSELRSSLCEIQLERTVLSPALLPVKTAQFTHFFPSGMMSHSKISQFNWECIGRFTWIALKVNSTLKPVNFVENNWKVKLLKVLELITLSLRQMKEWRYSATDS